MSMLQGIFANHNKNTELIKKIVSKMIKKLGLKEVKERMPEKDWGLVAYVERERRKRENKKKRQKLMALLGQEFKEKDNEIIEGGDSSEEEESDKEMQDH